MNLSRPCFKCYTEDGLTQPVYMSIEMSDDKVYDATCPRGHRQIMAIPMHKHELLFEIGAMAFQDGYPREAVVSFAASLERLYELCIRVICDKNGIAHAHLDVAWKHLNNSLLSSVEI